MENMDHRVRTPMRLQLFQKNINHILFEYSQLISVSIRFSERLSFMLCSSASYKPADLEDKIHKTNCSWLC